LILTIYYLVMRKKLLLINPVNRLLNFFKIGHTVNLGTRFQPIGLGIVAALTPDNWDVEIIDENFEPFVYKDADLVGFTAFTATATRAYRIAALYRKENIPTVIGGIHVSIMPEEASQYIDTVVIGEAESVWPKAIADFEKGKMKKFYHGERLDLKGMPKPRRELLHPDYLFGSIETSRGCPMDCEFCSVPVFYGHRYRQRPVEEILDELEAIPQKKIFFTDDNFIGYGRRAQEHAIALFKGMIERNMKKEWFCQVSMNIAENEKVLEYAAKAGCRMVFIGVEAEDTAALEDINKMLNLQIKMENYKKIFRRINEYGISVCGAFMYGMDSDTRELARRRTSYMLSSVDAVQITYLTPLPGTRLFEKVLKEKRLIYTNFPHDWEHYTMAEVTHRPLSMSAEELQEVRYDVIPRLYNYPSIWLRFFKTLFTTRRLAAALWAYIFNINYRNATIRSIKLMLKK